MRRVREEHNEVKLTVVVVGDRRPIVTWYRNGSLVNKRTFIITNKETGTNAKNETIVASSLTIKSPDRKHNTVFLAKAVYGDISPMSNTSTIVTARCKYQTIAYICILNPFCNTIKVAFRISVSFSYVCPYVLIFSIFFVCL